MLNVEGLESDMEKFLLSRNVRNVLAINMYQDLFNLITKLADNTPDIPLSFTRFDNISKLTYQYMVKGTHFGITIAFNQLDFYKIQDLCLFDEVVDEVLQLLDNLFFIQSSDLYKSEDIEFSLIVVDSTLEEFFNYIDLCHKGSFFKSMKLCLSLCRILFALYSYYILKYEDDLDMFEVSHKVHLNLYNYYKDLFNIKCVS